MMDDSLMISLAVCEGRVCDKCPIGVKLSGEFLCQDSLKNLDKIKLSICKWIHRSDGVLDKRLCKYLHVHNITQQYFLHAIGYERNNEVEFI